MDYICICVCLSRARSLEDKHAECPKGDDDAREVHVSIATMMMTMLIERSNAVGESHVCTRCGMWDVGCGGFRMTVVRDEMMGEVRARARVCVCSRARGVVLHICARRRGRARGRCQYSALPSGYSMCGGARQRWWCRCARDWAGLRRRFWTCLIF